MEALPAEQAAPLWQLAIDESRRRPHAASATQQHLWTCDEDATTLSIGAA